MSDYAPIPEGVTTPPDPICPDRGIPQSECPPYCLHHLNHWRTPVVEHGYGDTSDCLCGRNFDKVRGLREHLTKARREAS